MNGAKILMCSGMGTSGNLAFVKDASNPGSTYNAISTVQKKSILWRSKQFIKRCWKTWSVVN
jgi:hypothetical protein